MRFGLLVAGAAVAAGAAAFLVPDRAGLVSAVESVGLFAPVLAVVGAWALTLAMVPRTALAFLGGLLFGLGPGAGYVLLGTLLGASTAFVAGRLLGREFIDDLLVAEREGWKGELGRRMQRLDGWLGKHGILGVLTVRLLPIAPYGLVSYVFGASATRYRDFLIGSLIGATPSTFGYAALGASVWGPEAVPMALAVISALAFLSLAVTFGLRRVHQRRSPDPVKTG